MLGRIILNGNNPFEQTVAVTVYNPKASGSKNDLSNAEEERYYNYITKRIYMRKITTSAIKVCSIRNGQNPFKQLLGESAIS